MPLGFADCLKPGERWPSMWRQMTNMSCLPGKIDGKLVAPCTGCRLVLENLVDESGKILTVTLPPIPRK